MEMNVMEFHYPLRVAEQYPYQDCPNCGEYEYRKVVKEKFNRDTQTLLRNIGSLAWHIHGIPMFGEWETQSQRWKCQRCHYTESVGEEL